MGIAISPEVTARANQLGELSIDENGWHVDFRMDSDRPLIAQLEVVEEFLSDGDEILSLYQDEPDTGLHLSWTPRSPQDGIFLSDKLIECMAKLKMSLWIDTYLDC